MLLLRAAAKQELLQWDDAAPADIERALAIDPRSADALAARGQWYAIDGKDTKAIADFYSSWRDQGIGTHCSVALWRTTGATGSPRAVPLPGAVGDRPGPRGRGRIARLMCSGAWAWSAPLCLQPPAALPLRGQPPALPRLRQHRVRRPRPQRHRRQSPRPREQRRSPVPPDARRLRCRRCHGPVPSSALLRPHFASQQACNVEYWSMAGAPW